MTRQLLVVAMAGLACASLAGCSTRQHQADAAARDELRAVAHRLGSMPTAQWVRPSESVRNELEQSGTRYRVLTTDDQGRVGIAVWVVDLGADPFTDDTPRTGVACARVEPADPTGPQVETCPSHLVADPVSDPIDWSDSSQAHEQASTDISTTLAAVQRAVVEGGDVSRQTALRILSERGVVVRDVAPNQASVLRATLERTSQAPRVSDTRSKVSATTCVAVVLSLRREEPFYSIERSWSCRPTSAD